MEILELPDEILIIILNFVGIDALGNIFLTCKDINMISGKEELWEDLCRVYQYKHQKENVEMSFREYFRKVHFEGGDTKNGENAGGDLYTWGSTPQNRTNRKPKVESFFLLNNVTDTFCGSQCYSALVGDGEVYVWGINRCCRLGQKRTIEKISNPKLVNFDRKIRAIAHGEFATLFLTDNGVVFACGDNSQGYIDAEASEKEFSEPKMINFSDRILHISAGVKSFGCIDSRGRVFTWGNNMYSQLGHGTKTDVKEPKLVEILKDFTVVQMFFGERLTLLLTQERQLFAFGEESEKYPSPSSLMKYFEEIKIDHISCGLNHSAVIDIYGNCYVWGDSNHRCTSGAWVHDVQQPEKITSFFRCKRDPQRWERKIERIEFDLEKHRFLSVTCGDYYTVASIALLNEFEMIGTGRVKKKKVVLSWGYGGSGRLGHVSVDSYVVPTEIQFFVPKFVKKCAVLSCHSSSSAVIVNHVWIPDEEVKNCMNCLSTFSRFRRRRHHCRNCLGVFCGKCTLHKVPISKFGFQRHVRVCERCYQILRREFEEQSNW